MGKRMVNGEHPNLVQENYIYHYNLYQTSMIRTLQSLGRYPHKRKEIHVLAFKPISR